jgi:hypothetical protein
MNQGLSTTASPFSRYRLSPQCGTLESSSAYSLQSSSRLPFLDCSVRSQRYPLNIWQFHEDHNNPNGLFELRHRQLGSVEMSEF